MEYPSNSRVSKETAAKASSQPEKKVEKVTKAPVKLKKKSGMEKFADAFLQDDIKNVKSHIISNVIIPGIKKALYDTVTNTLNMMLYGKSGNRQSQAPGYADRVSYRSYSDAPRRSSYGTRPTYNYQEVSFDSREDAERVLNCMDDIIQQYGVVRIADYYDLAGITDFNYTANNYGWESIRSASVVGVPDGYIITLPKARQLD